MEQTRIRRSFSWLRLNMLFALLGMNQIHQFLCPKINHCLSIFRTGRSPHRRKYGHFIPVFCLGLASFCHKTTAFYFKVTVSCFKTTVLYVGTNVRCLKATVFCVKVTVSCSKANASCLKATVFCFTATVSCLKADAFYSKTTVSCLKADAFCSKTNSFYEGRAGHCSLFKLARSLLIFFYAAMTGLHVRESFFW